MVTSDRVQKIIEAADAGLEWGDVAQVNFPPYGDLWIFHSTDDSSYINFTAEDGTEMPLKDADLSIQMAAIPLLSDIYLEAAEAHEAAFFHLSKGILDEDGNPLKIEELLR